MPFIWPDTASFYHHIKILPFWRYSRVPGQIGQFWCVHEDEAVLYERQLALLKCHIDRPVMNFALSAAQEAKIRQARTRANLFLNKLGDDTRMSADSWRTMGKEGWLGLCLNEANTARTHNALDAVLIHETLGLAGLTRGHLFAAGAHLFGCTMGIANFGTSEQRETWCPALAHGQIIGALAFSEPSGGSDLANCETTLINTDDGLHLSGCKTYVTNGATAGVFLVLAKSGSQGEPFNMTVLIVPRTLAGLEIRPLPFVHGLATSAPAEITFENCRLNPASILGGRGAGLGVLLGIMQWERSCILAGLLGALDRDVRRVSSHLGQARATVAAPLQHQAVSHAVARLSLRVKAAQLMLYRSAWELDHGTDKLIQPAMCKLMISETLVECATELFRLTAGFSWAGGLSLGQALNDVVGTLSASGTSEVQLDTIAAGLGRI